MVTIQVYSRSSGRPVKGARVAISVGWSGLVQSDTDADGEAHFADISPGEYEYYVNGQTHRGRLEGRHLVYE